MSEEPPRKKRRMQTCSFCHDPGHTIRSCRSPKFDEMVFEYVEKWIANIHQNPREMIRTIQTDPFIEQLSNKTMDAFIYRFTPLNPSKMDQEFKRQIISDIITTKFELRKDIYTENVGRLIIVANEASQTRNEDDIVSYKIEQSVIYSLLPKYYRAVFFYSLISAKLVYDYVRIFLDGQMTQTIKTFIQKIRQWNIEITHTEAESEMECPVCYDTKPSIKTNCDHTLCKDCFTGIIHKSDMHVGPSCPMCRTTIETIHTADTAFEII